jgi:hypothetical protein
MVVLLEEGGCVREWDVSVARSLSSFIIPDGSKAFFVVGEKGIV